MRRLSLAGVVLLTSALLAPRSSVHAAPESTTFTRDVAPILNAKCVTCHRAGEVAPMALITYQDARPYARAIKEKVASRQMPPWFADKSAGTFANDPSLTDAEIATITRWVDAGAPQGDPKDMPKPPQFTEGWQLGEPDQIIELPEVQIPATGGDYFPTPSLTPDLKEDRWIRAIEIRPSNRQITHHSVIFSASIDMMRQTGTFDVLGVWAVGTPATVYPEGSGRWIRKGQMLRTNLHYHPNGTPQTDRTRIGLYFGKGELKKEVAAGLAGNLLFTIPANAANHELRAVYVADQDIIAGLVVRGDDKRIGALLQRVRRQSPKRDGVIFARREPADLAIVDAHLPRLLDVPVPQPERPFRAIGLEGKSQPQIGGFRLFRKIGPFADCSGAQMMEPRRQHLLRRTRQLWDGNHDEQRNPSAKRRSNCRVIEYRQERSRLRRYPPSIRRGRGRAFRPPQEGVQSRETLLRKAHGPLQLIVPFQNIRLPFPSAEGFPIHQPSRPGEVPMDRDRIVAAWSHSLH
jgi:hypothetical protein